MENVEMALIAGSAAITGLIAYSWTKEARHLKCIKDAPHLPINSDLEVIVREAPQNTIPYAVVEGTVQAVGKPLKGENAPGMLGVLQTLICREHKTYWSGSTRLWHDTTRLIRNITQSVPFVLRGDQASVKVDDALSASRLDIPVVHDSFEPSATSLGEHLVSWASGEKTKGFQTVERMLSEGTVLTGIGMLSTSTGTLMLGPPAGADRAYILSGAGFTAVVRDLQARLDTLRVVVYASGSVTLLLVGLCLWRRYRRRAALAASAAQVERVLQNRALEGAEGSGVDLGLAVPAGEEENACTICLANRRDVVLLECGHVCTCARCARLLQPPHCPICRERIKRVVPLYNS